MINSRAVVEQAIRQSALVAEGETTYRAVELDAVFAQLQHVIRLNFFTRAHTLGFLKDKVRLNLDTEGRATLPPEYCNAKGVAWRTGNSAVSLQKATASQELELGYQRSGVPVAYAKEIQGDGTVSITVLPAPRTPQIEVIAYRRLPPPKTIDDDIPMPAEWESALVFGTVLLTCSYFAIPTPRYMREVTREAWKALMAINHSQGAIKL